MSLAKEKFSSQADPKLLKLVRKLAKSEGRQLHSLIDEALGDLLAKRNGTAPRASVMELYGQSLTKYESLYKRLHLLNKSCVDELEDWLRHNTSPDSDAI